MGTIVNNKSNAGNIVSVLFAILLFVIGVFNIFLVHPVPGIAYILVAFLYTPQANSLLWERFGSLVPTLVKIALGIIIIMFTLGVSDLGDMIDKL